MQVLPEVWTEDSVNFVYLPNPTPTTRAFLDFMVDWEQRWRQANEDITALDG